MTAVFVCISIGILFSHKYYSEQNIPGDHFPGTSANYLKEITGSEYVSCFRDKIMIKYCHEGGDTMLNIRPVSDLRNRFSEVEEDVLSKGEPVFLTKNGYGSMVLLSLEQYEELTNDVELALDEADRAADLSDTRYSADEVFSRVRRRIRERKAL